MHPAAGSPAGRLTWARSVVGKLKPFGVKQAQGEGTPAEQG